MRAFHIIILLTGILMSALTSIVPAEEIRGPYEILNQYLQAMGGLDRLLAEKTCYAEGNIVLGTMQGTVKSWAQRPGRNRSEIALGPLNMIQGDNGEHTWVVDQNGKLQVTTNPDEATIKRRQVRRLIEEYAYIKRDSDIFKVSFEGIRQIEGNDCFVIKITNNLNLDSYSLYVNTKTFRQEKAVFIEDIQSRDVYYGDLRDVQGILIPFYVKEVSHQTGQVVEITFTKYESNPEIDPALFEPPGEGAKDYQFAEGDRAENIPIRFIGNHLFIPVSINGKERLWVLDTGAGITVLNQSFADELGLESEGSMKGRDASGVVDANFVTLPPFQVAGIQFQKQVVAVIDMDELIRRVGIDVVGILGFDFLSRFVTRVDFANERVSFYEPATFVYAGGGQKLGMHLNNSLFETEATLDGIHSGSWLFDLGASTTHLDAAYALREGYGDKKGVLGLGHGAGNEYSYKLIQCDSLQLGGFTIYEPLINFQYGGSDTVFTADQIGVLGNSLFCHFVLYCDYAHEQIIVEKGDRFNQSWPRDNSGLLIAWTEDRQIEVLYVSPDTPADKAGFKAGDRLKSMNGSDVASLDGVIGIRTLFEADPGTAYEVVVLRDGAEQKLTMTLAKLL